MRKSAILLGAECAGGVYFWLADNAEGKELRRPLYSPIQNFGIRDNELAIVIRVLTAWHFGAAELGLFQGIVVLEDPRPAELAEGPAIRRSSLLGGEWPKPDEAKSTDPTWTEVGGKWFFFPRTITDLWDVLSTYDLSVVYPDHGSARPNLWRGHDEWDMEVAGSPPLIMGVVERVARRLNIPLVRVEPTDWQRDNALKSMMVTYDDAPRRTVFRLPTGEVVRGQC